MPRALAAVFANKASTLHGAAPSGGHISLLPPSRTGGGLGVRSPGRRSAACLDDPVRDPFIRCAAGNPLTGHPRGAANNPLDFPHQPATIESSNGQNEVPSLMRLIGRITQGFGWHTINQNAPSPAPSERGQPPEKKNSRVPNQKARTNGAPNQNPATKERLIDRRNRLIKRQRDAVQPPRGAPSPPAIPAAPPSR